MPGALGSLEYPAMKNCTRILLGLLLGGMAVAAEEQPVPEVPAPEVPAPEKAAPEKPALKVEKFTLKDGRTLEGAYDREEGKLRIFTQSGRPMGTLDLKEDEIEKREASAIVVKDAPAEPKKREPPPKMTEEDRAEREVLEQVEVVNRARAALAAMEKTKKRHQDQSFTKEMPKPEEQQRFQQQLKADDDAMARLQKVLNAAQVKFDQLKAAYAKAGGKKTFEQLIK